MTGVKYYSYLDASGYSLAAIAYVRGLVNAGVPVQWVPLRRVGTQTRPWQLASETPELLRLAQDDDVLADLPALLARTANKVDYETVVLHCIPEHWSPYIETSRRNVAFTAWETDALPVHWPPLFRGLAAVLVPSSMNREVFVRAGLTMPVHAIPHIRRHQWNDFTPAELTLARQDLGIPDGDFVFYTINNWEPRKNIEGLLQAYIRTFKHEDPVTLLVKTSAHGSGPPPDYRRVEIPSYIGSMCEQLERELGRACPKIALLAAHFDQLDGRSIDALHEIGDCYTSLSCGEGWGLGAFEAATRGTPVLMTGWGGQCDFLGSEWPGAISYRMQSCPVWPPSSPSFHSNQRWAVADMQRAGQLMRDVMFQPADYRQASARISEQIALRFSEGSVTRQLLAALSYSGSPSD